MLLDISISDLPHPNRMVGTECNNKFSKVLITLQWVLNKQVRKNPFEIFCLTEYYFRCCILLSVQDHEDSPLQALSVSFRWRF